MKIGTMATIIAASLAFVGCAVWVQDPIGYEEHDSGGDQAVVTPYVNTYLTLPESILSLIAPSVEGYFSPQTSRYGDYLYPEGTAYDPSDLPCHVRADFNGDGFDDFAMLFSAQEWEGCSWFLTTKLLVALSTPAGFELTTDLVLGTVTDKASTPIEEYWSINWVSAGKHSVSYMKNGVQITESIVLDYDGFFLASIDPQEEALFYADGTTMYETNILNGGLAKKSALAKTHQAGEKRIIQYKKCAEGRVRPIQ
jgi:hypothetical protein